MSEPRTPPEPSPPPDRKRGLAAGDPYCANCGYNLRGATEASKCPECGRPLVEVLIRYRGKGQISGRRFRSETMAFGLPLVDVAFGPRTELDEPYGKAKGVIALGDTATGFIAVGGRAIGVVSVGGTSIGVCSIGGLSIGAVATGGGAVGGLVTGGGAIGVLASGGGAVGFVARGGGAIGYYAIGGGALGKYRIDAAGNRDPEAVEVYQDLRWYIGSSGPWPSIVNSTVVNLGVTLLVTVAILALAMLVRKRPSAAGGRS